MRGLGQEWQHLGPDTPIVPRTQWEQHRKTILDAMRLLAGELGISTSATSGSSWDQRWYNERLVPALESRGLTGDLPFIWIADCGYELLCFREIVRRELAAARREGVEREAGTSTVTWVLGVGTVIGLAALWWRAR